MSCRIEDLGFWEGIALVFCIIASMENLGNGKIQNDMESGIP